VLAHFDNPALLNHRAGPGKKTFQGKEFKMLKKRWFNLLIALALLITLVFTVREALAITALTSQTDARVRCADLPSRHSIYSKYMEEAKMWILYTEDGPVGVDGGLKELASAYRTCSR
jgi:hypothetical protein